MATHEDYLDDAVTSRVRLVRYENEVVAETASESRQMEAEAAAAVIAGLTIITPAAIRRVVSEVRDIIGGSFQSIERRVLTDFAEVAELLASNEARLTQTQVRGIASLLAQAMAHPYDGRTSREWVRYIRDAITAHATRQIRIGAFAGQGAIATAARLTGSSGLSMRTLTGMALAARTVLTGIHSYIREGIWHINPRIDRVMQISVLDSRTTDICRGYHGRIWLVGEGPRPPHHANCRSIVVPLRRGEAPPALETWNQWLRRQADAGRREVVVEALGPTRAALFFDGSLPLDRFTNRRGLRYSLAELRQRYPAAFNPPRG